MKKIIALTLTLLLVLSLAACGAPSYAGKGSVDYYEESYYDAPSDYNSDVTANGFPGKSPDKSSELPENRKWIVNVDLTAETEDLTALLDSLAPQIAAVGGYVEEQSISGYSNYNSYRSRYASMRVRVPADRLNEFLDGVSGLANVTSNNRRLEDVTLSYVATESRVRALETEETRLLELLEKAENLSDILSIEDRLTDVRYELEAVASSLRVLSNQVDYATVDLDLQEVKVYTPTAERTVWERICDGFLENVSGVKDFLEDFVVWFLSSLPVFALLAVIVVPVCLLVRHSSKKRKARKADRSWAEKTPEAPDTTDGSK